MTPALEKVLRFIQKNPNATAKEICLFTGKARSTIWNQTNHLTIMGFIRTISGETQYVAVKKK